MWMGLTTDGVRSMHRNWNLLAFDPGLTTGVAVWSGVKEDEPSTWQLDVEQLWNFLNEEFIQGTSARLTFICESYIISERTLKTSRQAWSLEIIGALKLCAYLGEHTLVMQQAAAAKRFAPNERLKAIGWYRPGRDHANDALRHMYLYAAKTHLVTV
jgi:hypothetical protein